MEQTLRKYFAEHADGLVAAYLFGSVARGSTRPDSDVDVAVLFETTPPASLQSPRLTMATDLEQLIGRRVDLVVLDTAPADLVHRVLRDGVILLDRDRAARIAFEVRRRAEYLDLQGVRNRYRKVGSAGQ